MRLIVWGLAGLGFIAASPAAASNEVVERGPVPEWVDESEALPVPDDAAGLFFLRREDTIVHLDENGQDTFVGQFVHLLNPQALQLGNVTIEWNPAAGRPVVHRLLIHRDGQSIDVLDNADFEILRREDQLEQSVLDGKLTAVLRVPDLRVGDDLDFAVTTPGHDPTLGAQSAGMLVIGPIPPPGRVRLGLRWTDGQKPRIKLPPELAKLTTERVDGADIRADNLKPASTPRDAPARYGWGRVAEYSDFPSWQAISQRFDGLFRTAAKLDAGSPLEAEAARIGAAYSDPMARARAALELVQAQVRYVYVGFNGGNLTPASADETWQRRYGDCKGKTALLLALLDRLDIQAEAVLANNNGADDGLDERLPNPGVFDHVLVRARIAGKSYWLDGTLPPVYGPSPQPVFPYRSVLALSAKGNALEKQAFTPAKLPDQTELVEIDARAGFDEPARQVTTSIARGVNGLLLHYQLSALTRDQLLAGYRNVLAASDTWSEVDSVDYRFDKATLASVVTVTGKSRPGWEDVGDEGRSMSLPGGGFSPPSRRERPADQDQTAPYYTRAEFNCHVTTVRLPEETKLDKWLHNGGFDMMIFGRLFYRAMDREEDRTIRMLRSSRVEEPEITPEKARRDNGRIADFDNSKANIWYREAETDRDFPDFDPVPATFERDWVADPSACLPPDLAEG